uniref:Galanin domain-containing protein n=1 Tax=Lates calcarifer TaxID=8187 RepID=A0A4W6CUG5_LATCA
MYLCVYVCACVRSYQFEGSQSVQNRNPGNVVPLCVCEAQVKVAPASSCVSGRIDHLIQIKDSPSARGRDELVTQYGIDGHRTLGDKPGLAGKRDMGQDEDFRTGLSVSHTQKQCSSMYCLKDFEFVVPLPVPLNETTSPSISQLMIET